MKRLWSGTDVVTLTLLRSELETSGIRFSVKNEDLWTALGDFPSQDIWPEIWIMDEDNVEKAKKILAGVMASFNNTCPAETDGG